MRRFNVITIIPVAPRDIGFLPACIKHLRQSMADLMDSMKLASFMNEWLLKIVIDGDLTDEAFQPTQHVLERLGLPLQIGYNVYKLDRSYGAGIARNYALACCDNWATDRTSNLVTFMDADDVAMPWWARTIVWPAMIHTQAGATGDPFVYASSVSEGPSPTNGRTIRWGWPLIPTTSIREALQTNNVMLTTGVCTTPRLLQEAGGFEPHLVCGEDGNLWRRVSELTLWDPVLATFYGVDLPVTFYKPRQEGQSRGLHMFSDKAFHLDKALYGPMGQKLDDQAKARSLAFKKTEVPSERIAALCGEVIGTLWKTS